MDAGGVVPASPVATLRNQPHSRSNDSPNAAQCSRSTPRRRRSASRAATLPQRPSQTASFHASRWWIPVRHEDGQRARDHEMVEGAQRMVDDPVPLLLVDHLATAVGEHARGA